MTTVSLQTELAPDFELPDSAGGRFRLYDHLGAGLLLVFYRGHWCPYCRRYLHKLQGNLARFEARGIALAAISPEPPATARSLAAQLGLRFPLLCDCEGRVMDLYEVRNRFRNAGGGRLGSAAMPHPSVFLIDSQAAVRFRRTDRNYKRRATLPTIFRELDAAGFSPRSS